MKLLIVLFVSYGAFSFAQTNTFPSSGSVGIGTTSPAYKLDLQTVAPTKAAYFQTTGTWQAIDFSSDGGVSKGSLSAVGGVLGIGSSGLGTNSFVNVNLSSGNVGLGTTSPIAKLHVTGLSGWWTSSNWGRAIEIPDASVLKWTAGSSGPRFGIGQTSGNLYVVRSDADDTSIAPRYDFVVSSIGNIGVGTTSPSDKLSVSGGAITLDADQPLRGGGRWLISGNSTQVTVGTVNPGINLRFDAGAASRMFVNGTSGNVGIGTSVPDYPLTVNGSIHAKEVRVDLSVPGPDYVFANDYKLPSLEEIKIYIDENKHLPEVPSAAAMEKNGVQLGEMNMLLLKKIEELTLYMLKQQQQIDDQKKEIDKLKENKK